MRFHSRRASPPRWPSCRRGDHHPRLMQTVILQILQRRGVVTDLKLWWNADTLMLASAAVARRSGFRCIYSQSVSARDYQAEVSLAADQCQ